jgi:single-strand DNA-binding protein
VARLRLAFTSRIKRNDKWEDESNYIDLTVWGRQGELACEHLAKGRQIGIQGRLQFREWEKDGQTQSRISVVVDELRYLGTKPTENGSSADAGEDDIPF